MLSGCWRNEPLYDIHSIYINSVAPLNFINIWKSINSIQGSEHFSVVCFRRQGPHQCPHHRTWTRYLLPRICECVVVVAPLCYCSSAYLSPIARSSVFASICPPLLSPSSFPTEHPLHIRNYLHLSPVLASWGPIILSPQPFLNIPTPHERTTHSH